MKNLRFKNLIRNMAVCLFGTAVLMACGSNGSQEQPAAQEKLLASAATPSYVKVVKDINGRPRFNLGGKPARFVGVNIGGLAFLPQFEIQKELDYAKGMGAKVVRVFAFDDQTNADAMAAKLKVVLDEANARGMYLTIALTGNYRAQNWTYQKGTFNSVPGDDTRSNLAQNDLGFYSRICSAQLHCLSDEWLGWGYGANYKAYALRVVSLLKDHPAIFSWDIANEVSGSSGATWLVDIVADFYVNMAAALKASDPNHMVTTGMISTSWAGMSDIQRDRVYKSANIDYLTVHEYNDDASVPSLERNYWEDQHQSDEVWRANSRYGKPVVIEEIGVRDPTDSSMRTTLSQQYGNRLFPARGNSFEATGVMHWGVSYYTQYRDARYYPDRLAANNWFPTFMKGWADTIEHETATLKPCGRLAPGASLLVDEQVNSCDGRFFLKLQSDGNLVLYQRGGAALWNTGTNGKGGTHADLQSDGNFVLYSAGGVAIWHSHTWNNAGATLYVQDDGNLVLYSARGVVLWHTGTGGR